MELQRFTRLGRVTRDLSAATDLDTVTDIITRLVGDAVSASVTMLALRDGDDLVTLGLRGTPLVPELAAGRFPLSEPVPICDAILTGQPVLLLDSEELAAAYPNLAGSDTVAMLAFPLRSGEDQAFGALALRFDAPAPRPEMEEIELLHIAADVCTQTVLRLRAEASSAERLRRIEFLSSASEQLARSLDHHATMQTVAELAVSSVADWCAVQLLEDGRLHTLVVAHSDPELAAAAHQLMTRVPTNPNAEVGSYAVARTGRSQLYSPVTVELIQRVSQDPELIALAEQLALQSVIVVPLVARGRTTGTMSLASGSRQYTAEDIVFAEDLARRAALAIDNADLFSQTQRAAETLQHALLPQRLPELKGWDLATLYQPSGRAEVGGDFFDVIDLMTDRYVAVIGDVMGRGVDAAATAARLQAAVRALVAADPDLRAVAAGLDRMLALSSEQPLVTLVLMAFGGETDSADVLVAGHPPPLLVGLDGTPVRWQVTVWPAFGVGDVDRRPQPVYLPRGGVVLLYTDGLVERRDEDLDAGVDRLTAVVRHSVAEDRDHLHTFLERVARRVRRVGPARHDDDVAMLAVRRCQ
ncbi:MAG TPA: GAF domain-containing SpoIIE family protein phosphatase [Lapillicoccus sp.]|jgi:serine phosphatase RsbU (regulator of sigma subunit)|uniref:GAF domain-containing SpoIIE family protein phosphatase n=1 Tax=Lapillicoccus sp. TaxID=1909287 RepID=UPI002F946659